MEELLKQRFLLLLHAAINAPRHPKLAAPTTTNEARLSFDNNRLLVILHDERLKDPTALENFVEVLLNETEAKEIDIILLVANREIAKPLMSTEFHVPWTTRLSITTLDEAGIFQEITQKQADNFIVSLIKNSLVANRSEAALSQVKIDLKSFLENQRRQLGEVLSFQRKLLSNDSAATYFLLVVIAAFYLAQNWVGGPDYVAGLVRMGANSSVLIEEGEYWRIVTSIFLHGGILHVLVNCYVLYALGIFFNKLIGSARFVSLFLVSGIAGSLASALIGGSVLSVGASGSLWGLLGLSGALIVRPSSFLPDAIRQSMRRVTLINLALNLGISFLPMIDIWAHLGGGIAGFLLGLFYVYQEDHTQKEVFNRFSAVSLVIIAILSIAANLYYQRPWQLASPIKLVDRSIEKNGISVGIPTLLSSVNSSDGATTFGNQFDPIQIVINSASAPTVKTTKEDQIQLLRDTIASALLELGISQRDIQVLDIDDFPTLYASVSRKNGERSWIWYQMRGSLMISVYILAMPQTPAVLLQDLQKIVESINISTVI